MFLTNSTVLSFNILTNIVVATKGKIIYRK